MIRNYSPPRPFASFNLRNIGKVQDETRLEHGNNTQTEFKIFWYCFDTCVDDMELEELPLAAVKLAPDEPAR